MILLTISIIIFVISISLLIIASRIKLQKEQQQELYLNQLKTDISQLSKSKSELLKTQLQLQQEVNHKLNRWQEQRQEEINKYIDIKKEQVNDWVKRQQAIAKQTVAKINDQTDTFRAISNFQKQRINKEIEDLRASLSAGVQARLREQKKKDKINFYKLPISDADLSDVQKLENLKPSFHKPVVLSKLIWTQYFQKQMTQLCDRVLGKKTVCGIYKITDLNTEQCYIGQSVDIAKRWKDHCKCGLGIDAPATNKLYNTMQKDGVWNFTFELLEQCPKELLNEKEKFWIQMYQSNKFGLNTTKGNL